MDRSAAMMYKVSLLLLIWCGEYSLSSAEGLCPVFRASTQSEKTGSYVVVLNKATNSSTFETVQSLLLELSTDSRISSSIQKVAKAITVTLTDANLDIVSQF